MEQPQYLIDTNAVIDYLGGKLPATGMDFMNSVINAVANVSVVTKIEVLGFNAPDEHYQLLTNFYGRCHSVGFDQQCCRCMY